MPKWAKYPRVWHSDISSFFLHGTGSLLCLVTIIVAITGVAAQAWGLSAAIDAFPACHRSSRMKLRSMNYFSQLFAEALSVSQIAFSASLWFLRRSGDGPDPDVTGGQLKRLPFSAWSYAKTRCASVP